MNDPTDYRDAFPVTEKYAYFQHPAVGALPQTTRDTLSELIEDMTVNGCLNDREWNSRVEETRRLAGELLQVPSERIGFVNSTSHGLSWLAESVPLDAGDSILVPEGEFPANQFAWENLQRHDIQLERIPLDNGALVPDAIEKAIHPGVRLLSVSSVQFHNGFRADLETIGEIVDRHDLFFVVDAIQSLGWDQPYPDELPIDALVADGHKWLCGPEGAGIIYLDEEFQSRLDPALVGWHSVQSPYAFSNPEFDLREDAGVIEMGSRNTIGLIGLGKSLELLLDLGLKKINEQTATLRNHLTEQLLTKGFECPNQSWAPENRSPIVSFGHEDLPIDKAVDHCLERNVQLTRRGPRLRAGVHFYNNAEDIEQLLGAVTELLS
jgi:selenocysteine lyase/cysteine desulfurase